MKIEHFTMFKMYFSYEGTEIMIPVGAPDENLARMKLRGLMQEWMNELSTSTLSPIQRRDTPMPSTAGSMNELPPLSPVALELRIEELVKDIMPSKKMKGAATLPHMVKEWTGFVYEPANYLAIISELEKIKND